MTACNELSRNCVIALNVSNPEYLLNNMERTPV